MVRVLQGGGDPDKPKPLWPNGTGISALGTWATAVGNSQASSWAKAMDASAVGALGTWATAVGNSQASSWAKVMNRSALVALATIVDSSAPGARRVASFARTLEVAPRALPEVIDVVDPDCVESSGTAPQDISPLLKGCIPVLLLLLMLEIGIELQAGAPQWLDVAGKVLGFAKDSTEAILALVFFSVWWKHQKD